MRRGISRVAEAGWRQIRPSRIVRAAAFALLSALVLCGAPKLTLDRLALHQFEDGDVLDRGYEFLPGETAYFSCRIANYEVDENDESHRKVRLTWTLEVRDPAGALLEAPAEGRIASELLKEDTEWLPKFLKNFVVPLFAPSGEYRISVRLHDEIADAGVSGELKFRVRGRVVEPSAGLAVRNFAFLSSEDDAFGMREPFYRPGDTAWTRMDVTGYEFEARNRFSIAFGMAVENSDGKQLFAEPDAGAETQGVVLPAKICTRNADVPPG